MTESITAWLDQLAGAGLQALKDDRVWMSVPQAGSLIGLGRSASYAAAHRGELPTRRAGKRLIVPKLAFLRWLEACDVTGPLHDVHTIER